MFQDQYQVNKSSYIAFYLLVVKSNFVENKHSFSKIKIIKHCFNKREKKVNVFAFKIILKSLFKHFYMDLVCHETK